MSEVLKVEYPLEVFLQKSYEREQVMRTLDKAGLSKTGLKRLRADAAQRKQATRFEEEDPREIDYCIALHSLDRWIEAEHDLVGFDVQAKKNLGDLDARLASVNSALREIRHLQSIAGDEMIRASTVKNLSQLIHRIDPTSELYKEVSAYEELGVERDYFLGVVGRFRGDLESRRDTLVEQQRDAAKVTRFERSSKIHARDQHKRMFTTIARTFENHHPFYYNKDGRIFVNVPRNDLSIYAVSCATESEPAKPYERENRANHEYFTKPEWRLPDAKKS